MKKTLLHRAFLPVAMLAFCAGATHAQAASTIAETAAKAGSFKTLLAAAEAAGLTEALGGEGPLTVFAPTDEAFAKLPEGTIPALLNNVDRLRAVLLYHVVPGKVDAAAVSTVDSATTLLGQSLTVDTSHGVKINGAKVTKADIHCSNGIIHVIDTVLLPQDIVGIAAGSEGFSTLVAAVKAAGLVETLQGEGPFTVLAPTDAAFAKLPEGTVASLLKPENKDKLVAVLTNHVIAGQVKAEQVVTLKSATTLQGSELGIAVKDDGSAVHIGDATVVQADLLALNGVIHVIDTVLVP